MTDYQGKASDKTKKKAALFDSDEEEAPYDPERDEGLVAKKPTEKATSPQADKKNTEYSNEEEKYKDVDYDYEEEQPKEVQFDANKLKHYDDYEDVTISQMDEEEKARTTSVYQPPRKSNKDSNKCSTIGYVIGKEGGSSKRTSYTIKGRDPQGEFIITRKYTDFVILRSLLVARWPGIFVPPIPPKQAVGNLDEKFIIERMFFLDRFIKNVEMIDYLFNSEETGVFIRTQSDVEKGLFGLQKSSVGALLRKYKEYIKVDVLQSEESYEKYSEKIKEFQGELKRILAYMNGVRKQVKVMLENKQAEIIHYANLVKLLPTYEEQVLLEYADKNDNLLIFKERDTEISFNKLAPNVKNFVVNPYKDMLLWVKGEIYDIKAFLEALTTRENLEKARNKLESKKNSDKSSLERLNQGKTTFKTIFSGAKGKQAEMTNLFQAIERADKDIQSYDQLLKIITVNLAEFQIPAFKQEKKDQYYAAIQHMCVGQIKQSENVTEMWSAVLNSNNLKNF